MKIFIDRVSHWLHLMPLSGKFGVMIITAGSNSVMETGAYLLRIMECLGLQLSCNITCTVDTPRILDSTRFQNLIIPNHAKMLTKLYTKHILVASINQESYFKKLQARYNDAAQETDNAALAYWQNNKMLTYKTYSEYLHSLQPIAFIH
jgi:hypothetical protein